MGNIIDGKAMAADITSNLKEIAQQDNLYETSNCLIKKMKLVIVTTGNSEAGASYVKSKVNKCKDLAIYPIVKHYDFFDHDACQDLCEVLSMNNYPPFIIQLPTVGEYTRNYVYEDLLEYIRTHDPEIENPEKLIARMDVDGIISPINIAYTYNPMYSIDTDVYNLMNRWNLPCTPIGVIYMLEHTPNLDLTTSKVTIIGRSDLVTKPLQQFLIDRNAMVTMVHSMTPCGYKDDVIQDADILISATGNPNVLTKEYLNYIKCDNKTLIDIGITRGEDGKLRGDCDPEYTTKFKNYTPVPGGVGPMTVAMLMCNVVKYYQLPNQSNYSGAIIPIYPNSVLPKAYDMYKYKD